MKAIIKRKKAQHPNSLANLIPPQRSDEPGRNPRGRPVDRYRMNVKEMAEMVLQDIRTFEDKKTGSKKDLVLMRAILEALAKKSLIGDVPAAKELFDRAYGKADANVNLNLPGLDPSVMRALNAFTEGEEC